MVLKSSKVIIPERGKQQADLNRFNFRNSYRDCLFTIYLPCAKEKPYYNSSTHSYIKLKINEYIPIIWKKLIQICTISEIIGIIPEKLENSLFYFFRDDYYYEHYPSYEEGDVERTSEWLMNYIKHYGTKYNFGYCTSRVFREICKKAHLECFPKNFRKESALFEFRKSENVKELTNTIFNIYKKILISRFENWSSKRNHPFKVLKFAKNNSPFNLKDFIKEFKYLKNPRANINTFCHESNSDKGIFFYFNKKENKVYSPKFILEFLDF